MPAMTSDPVILADCPHRGHPQPRCPLCETAQNVTDMSLHAYGLCGRGCRSLSHLESPRERRREGVPGKSGILIYYPDGTTNADPLPAEAALAG